MDAAEENEESIEVLPSTETDAVPAATTSTVTDGQWRAMKLMLENLLAYRDEEGHDPSKVFHKRVNKRNIPSYYDIIKEPTAFSVLKLNISNQSYQSFAEFVRDCALIWHNAHTYNRPDAGAYQDASTMKRLMEAEFQALVEDNTITPKMAGWPDLGEIPPVEDVAPEEEDDEDDEDDDDDEDDEADESDEDAAKRRRRGRPSISGSRRDTLKSENSKGDLSLKKKRGRPPKVDTPMEARIKNVLKSIRKPKADDGFMIQNFEKLPDKATMPEYYTEIKRPIAIEQIKKNQKRKRYTSVDHFVKDLDLMFDNAKLFNEDDSQIYKDAVYLQEEAHRVAEIEKARLDTEFVMEEGRKPRPDGIKHNGELWRVGDWVHIQNPNDVTKPIVAQIYRTWEDADGQEWVNACWYYRPEQTVHQYEKHFYPDEVVKTGQYRDHRANEIVGRCFVMFFTRYRQGRPHGIPASTDVYVCEARYNEEKHRMNKIKTWASCLPDEVRDAKYTVDPYDNNVPRRIKKVPSPLLYMLNDGKVTEEVPQLRWGVENAPPIIGGIHKGPREENQSPPPEPTPSPPPPPPAPAPVQAQIPTPQRQVSQTPSQDAASYQRATDLLQEAGRAFGIPPNQNQNTPQGASYSQQPRQYQQTSASPRPTQFQQPSSQTPHAPVNNSYQPPGSQPVFQAQPSGTFADNFSTPPQQPMRYPQTAPPGRINSMAGPMPHGQRSSNVYHLPESANAAIPEEIRAQFKRDDRGNVLFFDRPPLDLLPPERVGSVIGHSVAYLAAKIRRDAKRHGRQQQLPLPSKKATSSTNGAHPQNDLRGRNPKVRDLHMRELEAVLEVERAAKRPRHLDNGAASNLLSEQSYLLEEALGSPFQLWLTKVVEEGEAAYLQEIGDDEEEEIEGQERASGEERAKRRREMWRDEATAIWEAQERKEKLHQQAAAEEARRMWHGPQRYQDDINPRY